MEPKRGRSAEQYIKYLETELDNTRLAAHSAGTLKNLKTHARSYRKFCRRTELLPFPLTVYKLSLYAQHLASTLESPQSIENYVSGVKTLSRIAGIEVPQDPNDEIKRVMKGIKRLKGHKIIQARPITPLELKQMEKFVNHSDRLEATLWCAILFGFFLLVRKSNLVPLSHQTFNDKEQLTRSDIRLAPNIAVIYIKWSKTLQFNEREVFVPLLKMQGSKICPIRALNNMLNSVPGSPNDPAFSIPKIFTDKFGKPFPKNVAITYNQLQGYLKYLAYNAGIKGKISSHGLRRGGATYAASLQIAAERIQNMGDWASDVYKKYIDNSLKDRVESALIISSSIN